MFTENVSRLRRLAEEARLAEKPLVFSIPGSGLSAISAIEGGIPFLVVLNSGIYRISGVTSHASFLPFGNANNQTEALIRSQILPRCPRTPLVAGMLVGDPSCPERERFGRLKALGVAGIINWPAVSMNQGHFLEALRRRGFSEEREAAMLREAKRAGFVTFGFSASIDSAELFAAEAGVDVLIINVGWTFHGSEPLEKQDRVQYAIRHVNQTLEAVHAATRGKRPTCLFYGGGINTAQDTLQLYQQTSIDGLGVGSALEYFPVKDLMQGLSREFLEISKKKTLIQEIRESPSDVVGSSQAMLELYQRVRRVAAYDVNVCIEGESGAGKEVIATSLHGLSRRSMGPFITINCGAIPETLIESELFGHERGAFTGALERRLGKFELANHGTLFLDEVAELSPKAQVSLLRAIQQKEIVRVGGRKNISVDIRIITATNRCLKELVSQGTFRADLFYRLNTITLYIPPLRERVRDIEALVNHFLKKCRQTLGCTATSISKDFLHRLKQHSWPGNVRELQQIIAEAAIMEDGDILMGYTFCPDSRSSLPNGDETDDAALKLRETLARTNGNKAQCARLLGVSRKKLYQWIRKYGL